MKTPKASSNSASAPSMEAPRGKKRKKSKKARMHRASLQTKHDDKKAYNLPTELKEMILHQLGQRGILNLYHLMLTSKSWKSIIDNENSWEKRARKLGATKGISRADALLQCQEEQSSGFSEPYGTWKEVFLDRYALCMACRRKTSSHFPLLPDEPSWVRVCLGCQTGRFAIMSYKTATDLLTDEQLEPLPSRRPPFSTKKDDSERQYLKSTVLYTFNHIRSENASKLRVLFQKQIDFAADSAQRADIIDKIRRNQGALKGSQLTQHLEDMMRGKIEITKESMLHLFHWYQGLVHLSANIHAAIKRHGFEQFAPKFRTWFNAHPQLIDEIASGRESLDDIFLQYKAEFMKEQGVRPIKIGVWSLVQGRKRILLPEQRSEKGPPLVVACVCSKFAGAHCKYKRCKKCCPRKSCRQHWKS